MCIFMADVLHILQMKQNKLRYVGWQTQPKTIYTARREHGSWEKKIMREPTEDSRSKKNVRESENTNNK